MSILQEASVLFKPSFISDWYSATALNVNLSLLIIDHNLGEYPVKVDVQVKINEGGKDYIFSGLGSSQRDDDFPDRFGGVIYKYNDQHTQLSFPYDRNHFYGSSGLAFTGSDGLYHGSTYLLGPYVNGYVRTRVWLASDMPNIVVNTSLYMDNIKNYQEISHGLGYYPDLLHVQTLLSNGYMSDGIGVVFISETDYGYNTLTGVLFGYDDTKVRLWVPSNFSIYYKAGGVFAAKDGYKLGYYLEGVVNILAWNIECSQQVFHKTITVGDSLIHDDVIQFPCPYDLSNYLISVQFKTPEIDIPNGGMLFNAAGTTQANNGSKYGGIIYAYNENEVMIWRPAYGPVVYIGDRWGSGGSNQTSYTADVIFRVYHLPVAECSYPETVGNATFHVTGVIYGDNITYTCNSGYTHGGGDLFRTCGRSRQWSGIIPSCIYYPVYKNGNSTYLDIEQMRINKKETSSYMRSLYSAKDNRYSSFVIGLSGVSILVAVLCLLILPDLITVFKHMCYFETIDQS
ncbi:unnamed protein product [Mytilus coruscus]|uniref:Sushi domain-containing protein n=1 Tax=Mytilus coruscus TaxID=42192 RepID=A0A6J8CH01_MYTCO|nr:unnamed protein product [Mytilus coruscus]